MDFFGGKGDGRAFGIAFPEKILEAPDEEDSGGAFVEVADDGKPVRDDIEGAGARVEEDDEAEDGQENHADFFEHGTDLREKWGGVEARNSGLAKCPKRLRAEHIFVKLP